jgi:hypothetical protein
MSMFFRRDPIFFACFAWFKQSIGSLPEFLGNAQIDKLQFVKDWIARGAQWIVGTSAILQNMGYVRF